MNNKIIFTQLSPEQLSELIRSGIREELKNFQPKGENKSNPNDLLTRKETCDYLKCSETTLWNWAKQGKITATKIGNKKVMYKRSDVENFLSAQSA